MMSMGGGLLHDFRPPMRTAHRIRHYVPPSTLTLARPMLHYSPRREAYVLRLVGNRVGPVLRRDRRRGDGRYHGPERRGVAVAAESPGRLRPRF